MTINRDSVVTIHYTLKDDAGAIIDSSASGEPLAYIHGHGNIVPGLEQAISGHEVGDEISVRVPPAEGYGEYDKGLVQSVPRRALRGVKNVEPGMHLHAQTENGPRTLTVTRIVGDMVTLDGNHPLAGKHLNFDIRIENVRQATEEELSHGHVHGPGGHHHHG